MMKKWLLSAALAVASLTAHADNHTLHYNILEFQERANVSVPNDTMHMTLVVQEQHANRQTATQNASRKLQALQNKLKKYSQLKVEIGNRSVYPQHNNKNQITHWQDTVSLNVKSTDFEAMSQIIAESEKEAMLRGVSFSVSPEKRAKAVEQASEQALNAIKQRAEFLSKKMGFSGYNLVKVELNDSFEQKPYFYKGASEMYASRQHAAPAAAMMMDVSAEQAGEEEISQNVRVSIQMK